MLRKPESTALLFHAHRDLGWLVSGWVLAYVLISCWLATRCQPYVQSHAATRGQVNGKIVDAVTNVMNTKLFARRHYEREYLEGYLETEVQSGGYGPCRRTGFCRRIRFESNSIVLWLRPLGLAP